MNWIKTRIYTTTEGIDPLCGRLYAAGINGVQIEDSVDFNEFIENEHQYWDYIDESLDHLRDCETSVTVYVTDDMAGSEQLALIRESVNAMKSIDENGAFGRLEIETEGVCEDDWANNWKKYYKPLELGERILIRPEWEQIEDTHGRTVLSMNPGHLFGTGTHHTTQMCMLELDKVVKGGEKVLDMGCGSGILSILALLLGADNATAVDIDPAAPDTVGENLSLNAGCEDRCRVLVGDVTNNAALRDEIGKNYDLVVANIVADVIISISTFAYSCLRDGGTFVTSGIIAPRADEVRQAVEAAGFTIVGTREQSDWICFTAKK